MGRILRVMQLELPEIKLIEACKSSDERGSNIKIFSSKELKAERIEFTPLEILSIHSNEHVLRGMHFQKKFEQSRIISCLNGELFVAMVDVRPESKTKRQSCTYTLKQSNQYIYVPAGYALGTYAVEDSDFICMCGDYPFAADYVAGIRWDDPDIGIEWPIIGGWIRVYGTAPDSVTKKVKPEAVIVGVDSDQERMRVIGDKLKIETCSELDEALRDSEVRYAVISTSPGSHAGIIQKCLESNLHVFTELNLVSTGYSENIKLAEEKKKNFFCHLYSCIEMK